MPASSTIYKSMFGVSAKQDAAAMRRGGAGTGKGRTRRASASRGKSKERTSPLLEAQVVTTQTRHLAAFKSIGSPHHHKMINQIKQRVACY